MEEYIAKGNARKVSFKEVHVVAAVVLTSPAGAKQA